MANEQSAVVIDFQPEDQKQPPPKKSGPQLVRTGSIDFQEEKPSQQVDVGRMSAAPSTAERVASKAQFPYIDPVSIMQEAPAMLGEATSAIENYTQEGRAAHPVLSRIGDVTRGLKEINDIIGPELTLLGGAEAGAEMAPRLGEGIGEGLNSIRNAMARTFREPYTGRLKPATPRIPFARWITEAAVPKGEVGSITNPAVVPKADIGSVPEGQYYKTTNVSRALPGGAEQIGRTGSIAQESGYYPSVTKVPIRPTPPSPLTPESVPGPDTAGKGNLLSPIAKRGDPRAAQELMRRGRSVLYVPAEEYPGARLEGTFDERLGAEQSPTSQPPRLGEGTSAVNLVTEEAPKTNPSQEMMSRTYEIQRNQAILDNPTATAEEKESARNMILVLQGLQ